jgi:hypothetical protein
MVRGFGGSEAWNRTRSTDRASTELPRTLPKTNRTRKHRTSPERTQKQTELPRTRSQNKKPRRKGGGSEISSAFGQKSFRPLAAKIGSRTR